MRRTALKKKSKTKVSTLRNSLWDLCKLIIRKRYGNSCYTCHARDLTGSNWHTGHFVPSAVGGAYLRYELRNLRPQCYNCNINLGGNGAEFYRRMVEREGQEYVDRIYSDKQAVVKADALYYELMIERYTNIWQEDQKDK